MSKTTNSTDPLVNFRQKYSSKLNEEWGSPGFVLAGSVIASVIASFSIYYTIVPLYREVTGPTPSDGEGLLHSGQTENAWYSAGSGFVLALLIGLFMICAAGCLALTFATNKDAIIVAILAVIGLSLAFNFAFRACEDLLQYQFILWTIVAVVVGVLSIVYGIMQLRKSLAEMTESGETSENPNGMPGRKNWIYGLAGVGVVIGLVLIYVHWQVYGHITDRIDP